MDTSKRFLNDIIEIRIIALFIIWVIMNDIPVSAGFAIKENAIKADNSEFVKIELRNY